MVRPVVDEAKDKTTWQVKWTDQKSGSEGGGQFDAVFVCNGHYAVPHYGQVVDIDKFQVKSCYCTVRARLLYVTKPCDIGYMTV